MDPAVRIRVTCSTPRPRGPTLARLLCGYLSAIPSSAAEALMACTLRVPSSEDGVSVHLLGQRPGAAGRHRPAGTRPR